MGRSLLAALLLAVLFLGLALIIVMFGIVPALSNLTGGPTPRPVVVTLSPVAAEPERGRPTPRAGAATAAPVGTASPAATPTPTPNPTLVARANAVVERMLQNEAAGLRYRFTTVGTYALEPARGATNRVSIRVEGEVDGHNVRQVLSAEGRLPESQLSRIEVRTVNGVTYLYANEKWQVAPGDTSDAQQRFFREPVDLTKSAVRLEPLGTEQLADAPAPVYRYRISVPAGPVPLPAPPANLPQGSVSTVEAQQSGYLWVGADGRRYRLEYSIRVGMPQGGMMVGWDLATRYYDYDDPTIRVEAPK
jgi:hypothetical protein